MVLLFWYFDSLQFPVWYTHMLFLFCQIRLCWFLFTRHFCQWWYWLSANWCVMFTPTFETWSWLDNFDAICPGDVQLKHSLLSASTSFNVLWFYICCHGFLWMTVDLDQRIFVGAPLVAPNSKFSVIILLCNDSP